MRIGGIGRESVEKYLKSKFRDDLDDANAADGSAGKVLQAKRASRDIRWSF